MDMIDFTIIVFIISMMGGLFYMCTMYEKSKKTFIEEERKLRLQKAAEYNHNAVCIVKWLDE